MTTAPFTFFRLYTDASEFGLGIVILARARAFWSAAPITCMRESHEPALAQSEASTASKSGRRFALERADAIVDGDKGYSSNQS